MFRALLPRNETHIEYVVRRSSTLQRILGHAGLSLDQVINCPIAKNRVYGYYKLGRFITRRSEIVELEKQWNPLGIH
jgi:hypothetical protein